jgi:hypothetical protein
MCYPVRSIDFTLKGVSERQYILCPTLPIRGSGKRILLLFNVIVCPGLPIGGGAEPGRPP